MFDKKEITVPMSRSLSYGEQHTDRRMQLVITTNSKFAEFFKKFCKENKITQADLIKDSMIAYLKVNGFKVKLDKNKDKLYST